LFYLNFEKKYRCHPSSFGLTTPATAAAAIASRQALSKEKSRKGEREDETAHFDNNSE